MEEEGLQPALKGVMTPAQALHHAAKRVNQQSGVNSYSPWLNWAVLSFIFIIVIVLISLKLRMLKQK
jgi:hypothetical protein